MYAMSRRMQYLVDPLQSVYKRTWIFKADNIGKISNKILKIKLIILKELSIFTFKLNTIKLEVSLEHIATQ